MTAHLHTIEHAAQTTEEWVRDLSRLLDWTDQHRTLRLLRVTLQALRDWLDVNESAQLAAQLPLLVRGLYYEGWVPARTPAKERTKDAFVARIQDAFTKDPLDDPEEAICSVFRLLNHHVSPGEIRDVRLSLPRHLRELWPE